MAESTVMHFDAVDATELYWLHRVEQLWGLRSSDVAVPEIPDILIDEGRQIDNYCEDVKAAVGDDHARGFKDACHVLSYMIGASSLPNAVPIDPEDDRGVFACV